MHEYSYIAQFNQERHELGLFRKKCQHIHFLWIKVYLVRGYNIARSAKNPFR